MPTTRYRTVTSPVGLLTLAGDGTSLTHLTLESSAHLSNERSHWSQDVNAYPEVVAQLEEYFAGRRTHFDIALSPTGTAFRLRVWNALRTIPYAETRSYGDIAKSIGAPLAARAVGSANAHNPIAIIIPCHRVVGANGSLTGYSGGLQNKRALLELEETTLLARHS